MVKHNIKLNINFADAVNSGEKTFEMRLNDRGYQKGDLVQFTIVDKDGRPVPHPVTRKTYVITYTLNGWGIETGYIAFAIKRAPRGI